MTTSLLSALVKFSNKNKIYINIKLQSENIGKLYFGTFT